MAEGARILWMMVTLLGGVVPPRWTSTVTGPRRIGFVKPTRRRGDRQFMADRISTKSSLFAVNMKDGIDKMNGDYEGASD